MIFSEETHSQVPPASTSVERRSVLSTLGLTGLGFLASSAAGNAAVSRTSARTPKVSIGSAQSGTNREIALPSLPDEWTERQGALANDYLKYLTSLNLRTVSPRQVIEVHAKAKGGVWNSMPPKQWWKRMGYVLRVVDRVAMEMNVSNVEILSAYRAPAYNARCAGAKAGSWHQANVAADFKFPVRASKVTSTARELRDLGLFKGGVGGYWNFTHVDARGQNVNW